MGIFIRFLIFLDATAWAGIKVKIDKFLDF